MVRVVYRESLRHSICNMEPWLSHSRFCFLPNTISNVRTGQWKEYLTFLFSWFGKTKFFYPWTVILYILGSWTVPETPLYDPLSTNVKPAVEAGRRRGIGRGFDRSPWPGGRALELSCSPGSRDIWIFVRARNHKSFPGVGNFIYIWPHIFARG